MFEVNKMTLEEATAVMLDAMKHGYNVVVRINGEESIINGKCNGNCDTCKHCFHDDSVGYRECKQRDEMTEEQVEHYEANLENGCPFYEPMQTEEEAQAEDNYYMSLL